MSQSDPFKPDADGLPALVYRLAAIDDPISMHGIRDGNQQLVAEVIHDFSARNHRPFLVFDCQPGAQENSGIRMTFPIRKDLDELLELRELGLLPHICGGSAWMGGADELTPAVKTGIYHQLHEKFDLRLMESAPKGVLHRVIPMHGGEYADGQATATLFIGPLREKAKTIQFFANYFLARNNLNWNRQIPGLSYEALQLMVNYPWPGNLSELQEVVAQSVLVAVDGAMLPAVALPSAIREYQGHDPLYLKRAILKAEYDLICQTLTETKNNKRKAAEILKISRKTLYSKLRIFGEQAR